MNKLLKELRSKSFEFEDELIDLRRSLHRHPETGWSEYETSKTLRKYLAESGMPTPVTAAGTGFFIDITGEHEGPVIAYRADMDALPIQDRKERPYASQRSGFGHLCGHDVHSTVAAGVARLLYMKRDELQGTVRVFWQPAEEVSPSGAPRILKAGILDDIQAIYGIHCDPTVPSGYFSAQPGAETGSFDTFEITVDAESTTHSARPYEGKDTIWIAHQITQHLYQMIGRTSDVRQPAVLSICSFHGGDALNVIPHHVAFGGTLRTMNEQLRQQIREQMQEIIHGIGKLNGVECRVRFGGGAPSVINNYQMYRFIRGIVTGEIGDDKFLDREQSIGAEDFAYYTERFPGLFMRVGTANSPDTSYPLHHSRFDVDESVISPTSALMSYTLFRHLKEHIFKRKASVNSGAASLYEQ